MTNTQTTNQVNHFTCKFCFVSLFSNTKRQNELKSMHYCDDQTVNRAVSFRRRDPKGMELYRMIVKEARKN